MRIYVQLDGDYTAVIESISLTPFEDYCYYFELDESHPVNKLIWNEGEKLESTNLIPYNVVIRADNNTFYKHTNSDKIITEDEYYDLPSDQILDYEDCYLCKEYKDGEMVNQFYE